MCVCSLLSPLSSLFYGFPFSCSAVDALFVWFMVWLFGCRVLMVSGRMVSRICFSMFV